MYYRQKILLNIVDEFGKSLSRTDCQKLTLLFCKRSRKDFYNFFPHKFGGYSYTLNHDTEQLIKTGYFANSDRIKINKRLDSKIVIKADDDEFLQQLSSEVGELRGKRLVRKVYKEFPYYSTRSEIANEVFSPEEHKQIKKRWSLEKKPKLFTIGYEGISIDSYINQLCINNVQVLIDVRKNAYSRKFGFSKKQLQSYLQRVEIEYIHEEELGIPSSYRKSLETTSDYQKLFSIYKSKMLPKQAASIEKIKQLAQTKRIALTCFEADPNFCHRHKITEVLEADNNFLVPIQHIC